MTTNNENNQEAKEIPKSIKLPKLPELPELPKLPLDNDTDAILSKEDFFEALKRAMEPMAASDFG